MYPLSRSISGRSLQPQATDARLRSVLGGSSPMDTPDTDLLDDFIRNERPYLRQGYTLIAMSKDLGIPRHILSRMINQRYGKNFNALINQFRVDYLKDIPSREPNWQLYTMEALGKLAGFNSRNTLIKAFRKCAGESPSSYFLRVGRPGFSFVLGHPGQMN